MTIEKKYENLLSEVKELKEVIDCIDYGEERTCDGQIGMDWNCEGCGALFDNYSMDSIYRGDGICPDCFKEFNKSDIITFVSDCLSNIIKHTKKED